MTSSLSQTKDRNITFISDCSLPCNILTDCNYVTIMSPTTKVHGGEKANVSKQAYSGYIVEPITW